MHTDSQPVTRPDDGTEFSGRSAASEKQVCREERPNGRLHQADVNFQRGHADRQSAAASLQSVDVSLHEPRVN